MEKANRRLDWFSDKLRLLWAGCLMGISLLTCVDDVGRNFRHPFYSSMELVGFMATVGLPEMRRYNYADELSSGTVASGGGLGMGDILAVFFLVMGGLFFGLFTPTEAAGIGVSGVLVVSLLRRQLTWEGLVRSIYETLRTSCMVMFLIAGAAVFSKFLAVTRIPFNIASWIGGILILALLPEIILFLPDLMY